MVHQSDLLEFIIKSPMCAITCTLFHVDRVSRLALGVHVVWQRDPHQKKNVWEDFLFSFNLV